MKGIVLAGGSGKRLFPLTKSISKQLLPIYDKPMIFYPISTLMLAGIRDILIITTPADLSRFKVLLGDGSDFGVNLEYITQPTPDGLAQAFILGEEFIGKSSVCLILGDNIFYGNQFQKRIKNAANLKDGATVFAIEVDNPERYGVIEVDKLNKVKSIEEKPLTPKSNYILTGLYFYNNDVIEIAKKVKPSKRGELEITSVNNEYLKKRNLKVEMLDSSYSWFDTGTFESLLEASNFIKQKKAEDGTNIGCLNEISLDNGWV